MENLIKKAIQAINDKKIDYALGMLEAVLEMGDRPEIKINSKYSPSNIIPKTFGLDENFERQKIGELIKSLSKFINPENSFQETVIKFTDGIEATPENYSEIILRMTEKLRVCEQGVTKVDSSTSGGEVIQLQK